MWSLYPDSKPSQSGFYYTQYFNNERNGLFYKAHYYNHSSWIWDSGRGPVVLMFIEASFEPYYTRCLKWIENYETEQRKNQMPHQPLLDDHLAKFPYHVFISSRNDDRQWHQRHNWLRSITDGTDGSHTVRASPYGWIYGENAECIYRPTGAETNTPWRYIFKNEVTAVEFKLMFG